MRIIISPAKKMVTDTDSLPWCDLPVFLPKAQQLAETLQRMSTEDLKTLWRCSDSIASLNIERLKNMDLCARLTPAILAYEGIQYQHMAPGVFTDMELQYIQKHLRILSGLYGVLKPFDGVTAYRLEMQAKLRAGESRDLYDFWGSSIAEHLLSETDLILNLASKEYSICLSRYLTGSTRFITCIFGEGKGGKVIEKGTMCKMARGELVRYMAERGITDPEEVKTFDRLNYRFNEALSDENTFIFIRR